MHKLPRAATVLLTALLLAACGGEAPVDQTGLKVYRHAMDQALNQIDPAQAATVYSNTVVLNVYDTLYMYKYLARPYVLKPNLATDFPEVSEDGLTYTIRIRPGVYFIDDPAFPDGKGREVTAADFVYSLKRHFDPVSRSQGEWLWQGRIVGLDDWKANGSNYTEEVEGLKALDDHTIQIKLVKPYPQLTYTFAMGFSALVPHEAVEEYGREFSVHPVGSGPFKLDAFGTTQVVMSPNPNFRQLPVDLDYEGYDETTHGFTGVKTIDGRSPPFVDRLEIHFIGENSARWASFTKGNEVQFTIAPNEVIDTIMESKDPVKLKPEYAEPYHMYTGLEAGFVFSAFNFDFEEVGYNDDPERNERNKALRCAIIRAYDWNERNQRFYFGLARTFPGIIPPVVPEYDPNMSRESVELDIEGAKKLLADSGWTPENLPKLVYGAPATVIQRQYYEQFRGWMGRIGYPPEKIVLEQFATFGDLSKAWKQSRLPIVFKGWGLDFPDAENTLQLFYGPNGSPGSNDANWSNPEYDRLYEQSSIMQPSPERTALYRRMNEIVVDDCVAMTGISRTRVLMWHKDVIAFPDREILGGFFMRYVDLAEQSPAN